MGKSKIWRLLAMLLAFSLVAAACGSGDEEVATDDGDTTTTETTATDDGEMTETTATEDDGEMTEDDGEMTESATVEAAPTCAGDSDGVLQIGGLLPQTGNLAFLGPPEEAGAALAVEEINAAGGVNGADVVFSPGDSSDNADVANQTVDRHLASGVDVILGAASSGVSFTVIDKITQNCKIHFSPANTSPDFTDYAEDDLYFRTAPSDILQGRVLADLIVNEGNTTVTLMALQDPYGEGLLRFTKEPLEEAGVEVVEDFVYDPTAQNFDAEVQKVIAAGAEAVVVIGFDESATILTGLFEAGVEGTIYLVDGNIGNALGAKFSEPGVLEGIKGTLPAAEITADFRDRLLAVDPALVDFSYGPETYDAVIISALAAQAAGTDNPAEMAKVMNGVTRDGEKCTSFADCKALLEAGTDIDYDGPSGPQAFGPAGEPTEASFAILQYGNDNQIDASLTTYQFAKL
ncbi:MAG: ABC transporter substrate-binding protein [Acidimicrobiales bacterium]|nr:ABC transporter substrate-binding protein [Acidimicrobiales bacterium]